ncbi:MAG: hypothetical protein CO064_04590 [Anaerolineae bacterium CG_4_9_14_0_8_um_filter_58_9]|nr:MAG: hypothetical protein CO064_04590 [Anaerolineae bacterium CG_4_9_14_0_8_um_filter_58_9]
MSEKSFSFDDLDVFTTGALLQPLKVVNRDGSEVWFWVVSEFIDDTFRDGQVYNPPETAKSKKELLKALHSSTSSSAISIIS